MTRAFPQLRKSEQLLTSMAEREAALESVCQMAVELLRARGILEPAVIEEEPLPQSTIDLLRRMPRS